ncbi:MAG: response regulator [Chloroflexi bacterium]|nr:response regulator [Chloroflexota bacterium]
MPSEIEPGRLRSLVVDDSDDDALLLVRELTRGKYTVSWKRAETPEMLAMLLRQEPWDIVLADYALPEFSALAALRLVQDSGQDLPFIVVSGVVNEEIAVEVMKAGAHDFLAKDKLSRLVPAVAREIREAILRRERNRTAAALRLLTAAGATLTETLDYAETLEHASHVAVPGFADQCYIDLRGDDAIVRRVAIAAVDPTREAQLRDLARGFQPGWELQDPAGRVFVEGVPIVWPTSPNLTDVSIHPDLIESSFNLRQPIHPCSFLIVPLRLRNTSLGVISFIMTESGRQYSADDVSVAEELAHRVAMALDNCRLYTAERHAHAEAEVALRMRNNFLAVASHELRSPVTLIKGTAQLLLSSFAEGPVADAEVTSRLQTINTMSDRLTVLITDLLDASRLRTGQLSIQLEPVDFADLVREIVNEHHSQLGSPYPLVFTTLDMLSLLNVDRHRMQQALSNVLENAIKYSPGGGRIEVTLRARDSGVLLTVSDEGIGIPREGSRTIFQPFARAMNAQNWQLPGMGLGLYIARQIVDQHGGRIWTDSAGEGRGTVVSIWLPNAAEGPRPART